MKRKILDALILGLFVLNLAVGFLFYNQYNKHEASLDEIQRETNTVRAKTDTVTRVIREVGDIQAAINEELEKQRANSQSITFRIDSMRLYMDLAILGIESGVSVNSYTLGGTTRLEEGGIKKTTVTINISAPDTASYVKFITAIQREIPSARLTLNSLPTGNKEINMNLPITILSHEGVVGP